MTLYTERIVDQTDHFADAFVSGNVTLSYDIVMTIWRSKVSADAILFREIQCKKTF